MSIIYHITGLTAIASTKPYFRKHILHALDTHDFIFITNLFILFLIILYFLYFFLFDTKSMIKSYNNCCNKLSHYQMLSILCFSVIIILETVILTDADKYHNTPLINFFIFEMFAIVSLFMIEYFIFNNQYSWSKIIGSLFIIVGIGFFVY